MPPLEFSPAPAAPKPPVRAYSVATGVGKTAMWRAIVAAELVATGDHPVLAVPRHRLGDEVARELAAAKLTAAVYRSREAIDPDGDGDVKMCRDLGRVELISGALGDVSRQACKQRLGGQCVFYNDCGYQRQRQAQPDVWAVPHQLLFNERPSFIPAPTALGIDESFWGAATRGLDRLTRCRCRCWFRIGRSRAILQVQPI